MQLCHRTLIAIKEELNPNPRDEFDYPAKVVIANFECEYLMGMIMEGSLNEKMTEFLLDPRRKDIDNKTKSKGFFKLGHWQREKMEELSEGSIEEILNFYNQSLEFNQQYYKAWHSFGLLNFKAVEFYKNNREKSELLEKYINAAVKGFISAVSLGGRDMFQDSLRLLNLVFSYGNKSYVGKEFRESFKKIDMISWIEVVPQIIARIDIPNEKIQELLHELLVHISRHHPQALIYQLTVAAKSKSVVRNLASQKLLNDMKNHSKRLVDEAMIISEELIRTAILLKELWHEGIEEAWKAYSSDKNINAVLKILFGLHEKMEGSPESLSEITFHQSFRLELEEAKGWLHRYFDSKDEICLNQAFDIYYHVYRKINTKLEKLKVVHLDNVSPKLLAIKNCDLSVPGLYTPHQQKPVVRISGFSPILPVLASKQHPRKLFVYGSDEKEYHFLLKGHEDLRQDERVIQLFSLVNRLLNNDPETEKKDLSITCYSVIPLSTNSGLIGWVQKTDTLQQLIREYRENHNIRPGTETSLMHSMCPNYDALPLPNKVEIFRHVLENTKGEDLQKVLWLKSPNSEIWLERRTNYTRSLATMSMVGYILGLGDRHPSNIMLQRFTGRIVHIDFGDCWEVAMKREKFPERVPFRLTRMLVKAMEACGIEGNYRNTCEIVMRVLRENKESLMAVLEAFLYDPLLNWRLLTISAETKLVQIPTNPAPANNKLSNANQTLKATSYLKIGSRIKMFEGLQFDPNSPKRKESTRERELQQAFADDDRVKPTEILNQKAIAVLDRIKKKLLGKEFNDLQSLTVLEQVNKLIKQAASHENICQAYLGWCPFW